MHSALAQMVRKLVFFQMECNAAWRFTPILVAFHWFPNHIHWLDRPIRMIRHRIPVKMAGSREIYVLERSLLYRFHAQDSFWAVLCKDWVKWLSARISEASLVYLTLSTCWTYRHCLSTQQDGFLVYCGQVVDTELLTFLMPNMSGYYERNYMLRRRSKWALPRGKAPQPYDYGNEDACTPYFWVGPLCILDDRPRNRYF